MRRTPRPIRVATEADLTADQRKIYGGLSDDLRKLYLSTLPPIRISMAGNRRKAQSVRSRMTLVDDIIAGLRAHVKALAELAKDLEQGHINANTVDLRQALKPPSIAGVAMRYVRGRGPRE